MNELLADDHQEPVIPIPPVVQVVAVHVSTIPVLVHVADDLIAVRVGLDDAVDRERRVRGHLPPLECESRDSDVAAGAEEVTTADLVDHLLVGGVTGEVVRQNPGARHRAPLDLHLKDLREALEVLGMHQERLGRLQEGLEVTLGDLAQANLFPKRDPLAVSERSTHLDLHFTDSPGQ